ncbi:MAG: photosystem II assembly family protein [Cyanobium sp.]
MAKRPGSGPAPGAPKPLDPELRRRLLLEARTPWRSLRRGLWFALVASAGVGLATMALRASAGGELASSDLVIQVSALTLFGSLLWFDRNRDSD